MSAARRSGDETREPDRFVRHYDREERLALKHDREPERGGLFARNRSLLIILLDIVLVLVMFVLYLLFLRPDTVVTQIDGFTLGGSAFVFDTEIYLTVTIGRSGDAPLLDGAETLVRIAFPDGADVTDTLPTDPEYPTIVRHVLSAENAERFLQRDEVPVSVTVRGRTKTYRLPLH